MARALTLERLLQSQGFGSRKECRRLVEDGRVTLGGAAVSDPDAEVVNAAGARFTVDGEAWVYREHVTVLLHKPAGYECSARPQHHPSVLELLPEPFVARGVQPVGRLDVDTTGLLLLSDDGAFIHAHTSPKRHVEKVYRVTTASPVTEAQLATLRAGVKLDDEAGMTAALEARASGERTLELTLAEGKYHQVKRMVAAVGNHVAALHRVRIGEVVLPEDLPEGEWRFLDGPVSAAGDDTSPARR